MVTFFLIQYCCYYLILSVDKPLFSIRMLCETGITGIQSWIMKYRKTSCGLTPVKGLKSLEKSMPDFFWDSSLIFATGVLFKKERIKFFALTIPIKMICYLLLTVWQGFTQHTWGGDQNVHLSLRLLSQKLLWKKWLTIPNYPVICNLFSFSFFPPPFFVQFAVFHFCWDNKL